MRAKRKFGISGSVTAAKLLALMATCALPLGCHSAFVDATIRNGTAEPISLVEIDYPNASFGTQSLAPGARYHYRFKVLGNGSVKLVWTDIQQHEHSATGPTLREEQEGSLQVVIGAREATWTASLHPSSP